MTSKNIMRATSGERRPVDNLHRKSSVLLSLNADISSCEAGKKRGGSKYSTRTVQHKKVLSAHRSDLGGKSLVSGTAPPNLTYVQ